MTTTEANNYIELLGCKEIGLPFSKDGYKFFNNFAVKFSGTYYFIIHGRFPVKIAEEIEKNAIKLKIRLAGGCEDWQIKNWCKHKDLIGFMDDNQQYSIEDKCNKYKEFRQKLINEDYENCYIETYHIDTLEGLKHVLDIIKKNELYTKWFD